VPGTSFRLRLGCLASRSSRRNPSNWKMLIYPSPTIADFHLLTFRLLDREARHPSRNLAGEMLEDENRRWWGRGISTFSSLRVFFELLLGLIYPSPTIADFHLLTFRLLDREARHPSRNRKEVPGPGGLPRTRAHQLRRPCSPSIVPGTSFRLRLGCLMTPAELREKYPKFFGTMAYPYMNGTLHAGHSFTAWRPGGLPRTRAHQLRRPCSPSIVPGTSFRLRLG
jgi:hypothetical protein